VAGKLNDTGITAKKADHDDSQYGRDFTHNDSSDGHAGFSFEKITSGGKTCIVDKVTGLTWSPDLGASNWNGINTIISTNNNLCGLTGWRLPSVKDLVSIVSYHRINPAIDNDATRGFFSDTVSVIYWTSTINNNQTDQRWGVHFGTGAASNVTSTDNINNTIRVRLVR
jgi:hypothetical protein